MFVIHSVSNTGPRPEQNRNNSYKEVETQLKRELEEARLNLTNLQRQQTRYQEAEAQLKSELEEAHLDLTKLTPKIFLQEFVCSRSRLRAGERRNTPEQISDIRTAREPHRSL